ncbi:MAG: hypothetical protein KY454_03570 [Actinobacteria bacterium]|nr:hypothetical protein [Actinomycetota bacterium]MBW3649354.1 hypothetical protein [Actinomycetota bacterium]
MVFLLFLLLAVQVIYHLYATSVVTAAAHDGARLAAGADMTEDSAAARAAAGAHVVELLGAYGRERLLPLEWQSDEQFEVLVVRGESPSFLPAYLRRPLGMDEIRRTARVRREREVLQS